YVRVPGWASGALVAVNGKPETGVKAGEYLPIRRDWKPGDAVMLQFPMNTEVIASNPRVTENRGKVAVRRGPIIYCLEELDQTSGFALSDAAISLSQRVGKDFQSDYKAEMLGGVAVLHHQGRVFESASAKEPLYIPTTSEGPRTRPENLTFIPYYVWANRQPSAMQVWTPYIRT